MDNPPFRPKGPLPLFLADFERDTVGWRAADKFRYLRVLDHIFRQGGYIPDDDDYLAEVMGLRKGRGWRQTVGLIRSKLTRHKLDADTTKRFANGLLTPLQTVSFSVWLSQKRVLADIEKAKAHSEISRKGGLAKAVKYPADGTRYGTASFSLSKKKKKEGADAPRQYAFVGRVIRLKSDDLETWRSRFKHIPNIEAELTSYDGFLSVKSEDERRRWFHRTPAWLAKKDAEYAAKPSGERVPAI